MLSYLTFSPATADNRLVIWEYASKDVERNPIWGIGFNDWSRPHWMPSSSMDAFWLVTAVQGGLPAALCLMSGVILLAAGVSRNEASDRRVRRTWLILIFSLTVAAFTVHFWTTLYAFFFFLLGIGAWMADPPRKPLRAIA
jgi:hypothetical protein